MTDRAIVIGDSPDAVVAKARARRIKIVVTDIRPFSSLTTVYAPGYPPSGDIEADQEGYVVFGEM